MAQTLPEPPPGQPSVLVAEDELIIGYDLCDTLEEAGFVAEGPHADISSAMLAIQKRKPDLAILDVRLQDGDVYPFAEKLMQDDVPVIFHSGEFTPRQVRNRYPQAAACSKPCPPAQLIALAREVLLANAA